MRLTPIAAAFATMLPIVTTTPAAATKYRQMCDASAAVAVDDRHFLVAGDEDETILLYANVGSNMEPEKAFDFADQLRGNPERETDIEGAARIGDRIFWITSHGRNRKGKLRMNRYRLFATDVAGAEHDTALTWVGRYDRLIEDMLDDTAWEEPITAAAVAVIEDIRSATQLDKERVENLAPKIAGLNIEGLAVDPEGAGLLIGFRNPVPGGKALVVSLANPQELVTGMHTKARFTAFAELDLGGLGIRSIEHAVATNRYVIIAGPNGNSGPFKLYAWDGSRSGQPEELDVLIRKQGRSPEALVVYGGSRHVQILNDEGRDEFDGDACKDHERDERRFRDEWKVLR